MHVQYLDGILACQKACLGTDPSSTYETFSGFSDCDGYGRFVLSSSWLCMMCDYESLNVNLRLVPLTEGSMSNSDA
jgi:hypothetical protein